MSMSINHIAGRKAMLAAACLSALAIVPLHGAAAASDPAGTVAQVQCGAAPQVQAPPRLQTTTSAATLSPVCSPGQVPLSAARFVAKMLPPGGRQPSSAPATTHYVYAYGYQYRTAIGSSANFSQSKPYLSTADSHTLAEMAGESSDGRQIVEVGWTVDRGVNAGDINPHLFVYHWVNGAGSCYNGCGWVQVSATRYPGMPVTVTSTPQQYAMEYYQGNWWVWYQSEWIGYFPSSLWNNTYIQVGLTQWFGEVAASSTAPCTDMGNGSFGTSSSSAVISNIYFINGPFATPSFGATNTSYYNTGTASGATFHYGGPGAC